MVILMTKRKQSLCQNKTGFDYQLNTLRISYFQRKRSTLGLLICKSKDNVLAQYALESSNQPIGISEYELSKLYPTNFKGTLPSIEDIENELK